MRGRVKERHDAEDLLKDLEYLSREDVYINAGNQTGLSPIVKHWAFDGEYFDIEFSVAGLEFIKTTDDPRREMIGEYLGLEFRQSDLRSKYGHVTRVVRGQEASA